MSADNFTTITGNVTRDPETRYTPNGASVTNFGVAVNRRWQNRQTQEWEEEVSFFDVTAWSQLGENVANSVYKGDRVTVTGRLNQRTWEDKDTGANRSKIDIIADDVSISLRWVTVPQVIKNEKQQQGGRPESAGGRPAQAGGRPSGGRPAPAAAPEYAEEPF